MCFKNSLCQVLCLVITVILYPGVTAECDSNSIESLISYKLEKLEQSIIENLKQEKTDASEFHHDSISCEASVSNITEKIEQKITEKLAALTMKVQQMADSNQNLRKIADKIDVRVSGVEKQLTNVEKKQYQAMINVIPSSCATLNIKETNTYSIRPAGVVEPFLAFCDFEDNFNLGGGWTVFQRRFNGVVDFFQNWTMYKNGFGDVTGEHWLGLEKLHLMTRSGRHEMLVFLEDHEGGTAYAHYDSFQISSEAEKYKLTVGGYSGTAGDSLNSQNEMKFSTFDQDNDAFENRNCAQFYSGAWWFNACYACHLNGKYNGKLQEYQRGVQWQAWKGWSYSLKSTKMMLRPRSG